MTPSQTFSDKKVKKEKFNSVRTRSQKPKARIKNTQRPTSTGILTGV